MAGTNPAFVCKAAAVAEADIGKTLTISASSTPSRTASRSTTALRAPAALGAVRLLPSNLGQLIGRLEYGELERPAAALPDAPVPAPSSPRVRICRTGKAHEIAGVLARARRPLLVREIAATLGMQSNIVSAFLCQMTDVERLGEQRPHTWRLKAT
jgi:hypothetical protein